MFSSQGTLTPVIVCIVLVSALPVFSRQRCYGNLGCFSSDWPFNNVDKLPVDPSVINTTFWLYPANSEFPRRLLVEDAAGLQNSGFNHYHPTKIVIHGFMENRNEVWIENMIHNFQRQGSYNIISVDWSSGCSDLLNYPQAVANCRVVGAEIGRLIRFLNGNRRRYRQYHVIGHSLGAHIAGYAGERLGGGLARVTGLDPAGPNFKDTDPQVRLDPGDAQFVDVIHTDGSGLLPFQSFGMMQPLGHADFYPNGGRQQPGCGDINTDLLSFVACNHHRSVQLFAESITSTCPFTAWRCGNDYDFRTGRCECDRDAGGACLTSMGFRVEKPASRGKYYLDTFGSAPFCVGNEIMDAAQNNIYIKIFGDRGSTENMTLSGLLTTGSSQRKTFRKILLLKTDIGSMERLRLWFVGDQSSPFSFLFRQTLRVECFTITSLRRQNDRLHFCENSVLSDGQSFTFRKT